MIIIITIIDELIPLAIELHDIIVILPAIALGATDISTENVESSSEPREIKIKSIPQVWVIQLLLYY